MNNLAPPGPIDPRAAVKFFILRKKSLCECLSILISPSAIKRFKAASCYDRLDGLCGAAERKPRPGAMHPNTGPLRDTYPALPSCHQPSLQQDAKKNQSCQSYCWTPSPHVSGTPWVVSKDLMEKRKVEKTERKRDTHVGLF